MAEEVKAVVNNVTTPEKVVETAKVDVPKTVSVEEYSTLQKELEELKTSFQTRVNQASKAEREKQEKALAKEKMSLEERIKAEAQERIEVLDVELKSLKTEKKQFKITQQLAEAQLPKLFANDVRLVNADIDDIPKVIKELKKEYAEFASGLGQNAVGGTAPKTPPTQTQGTSMIDNLAKQNPQLARFLKPKR
jgi:DNA repair exonuclease SbcCD ATPase subunit